MKSSSFESPRPYLLTLYLKDNIAPLLTPACHDMMKSANLLHKCGLGDSDMNSTVQRHIMIMTLFEDHQITLLL